MIIFGVDPGVSGAISVLENKKVIEVFDMPTMIDGKKNKKQVNGSQVTNIIKERLNDDKEIHHSKCHTMHHLQERLNEA